MSMNPSKEEFYSFMDSLQLPRELDRDFLFDCLATAMEGGENLSAVNPRFSSFMINPAFLAMYLINEHIFYLSCHPEVKEADAIAKDGYRDILISVSLDKYYTNEHLAYQMGSFTSRFSPTLSTIDLYLNFILGMLSRYKKNEPEQTLLTDIMMKGFQMANCVCRLLEGGFETEAFSTWRTLHENECILQVLIKHGKPVIDAYLKHIGYGIAFRGGYSSKEKTDAVFVEIKEKMRKADLKSKDMKRFIEYGWLLAIDKVTEIEGFKLNFRDGVQRVAGLSNYSKVYEMSSEIAHSSPLLIYSEKNYFYHITILNLYESFFRLEKIFASIYMSTVGEEERQRYLSMRSLYSGELLASYNMKKAEFTRN